jgi:cytochrome c553
MNNLRLLFFLTTAFILALTVTAQDHPPAWAYVLNPPGFTQPPDGGAIRHVPDSTAGWTITQLRDFYFSPDWHPNDHPPMPEVVARGRKPEVFACGFCHRAEGTGGPENARLAGLPEAYIIQQMAGFKSGARTGTRGPTARMIEVAKAASDAEVAAAAAYFSSLKPNRLITVKETDRVPKTYIMNWILTPVIGDKTEPLGHRIIETPEDLEQFESRDTRSKFVAYVPKGSIAKGRTIATSGVNGLATTQCTLCHGPDLKGLGPIPGIAGRSPSYIFRQLYDIQHGQRSGPGALPMKQVVEKLSEDDMIAVTAYAASLAP